MKIILLALLLTACGDNWLSELDGGVPDAAIDGATPPADAMVDAPDADAMPPDEWCVDPHSGMGRGHVINCEKHAAKK